MNRVILLEVDIPLLNFAFAIRWMWSWKFWYKPNYAAYNFEWLCFELSFGY